MKQAKLKEICEQNRKAALAATETVVNLMGDTVNDSVTDVFVAEKKLEKESKGLQTNTAHFAKQTHQWLEMIKQFNNNLKVGYCPLPRSFPCAFLNTTPISCRRSATSRTGPKQ